MKKNVVVSIAEFKLIKKPLSLYHVGTMVEMKNKNLFRVIESPLSGTFATNAVNIFGNGRNDVLNVFGLSRDGRFSRLWAGRLKTFWNRVASLNCSFMTFPCTYQRCVVHAAISPVGMFTIRSRDSKWYNFHNIDWLIDWFAWGLCTWVYGVFLRLLSCQNGNGQNRFNVAMALNTM